MSPRSIQVCPGRKRDWPAVLAFALWMPLSAACAVDSPADNLDGADGTGKSASEVVFPVPSTAFAGSGPAGGHLVITEHDNGETFPMTPGSTAFLRLTSGPLWDEPVVEGTAVKLIRNHYEEDPGFEEWVIHAERPGKAPIRTVARANPPDPEAPLLLEVEIIVVVEESSLPR